MRQPIKGVTSKSWARTGPLNANRVRPVSGRKRGMRYPDVVDKDKEHSIKPAGLSASRSRAVVQARSTQRRSVFYSRKGAKHAKYFGDKNTEPLRSLRLCEKLHPIRIECGYDSRRGAVRAEKSYCACISPTKHTTSFASFAPWREIIIR